LNLQEQAIKDFEEIKEYAELRLLSKKSLERPLSETEFIRFKNLSKKLLEVK
jgi:hypothetical protein